MGKESDKETLGKITNPSLQKTVSTVKPSKELDKLLSFGSFSHGETTETSRTQIKAIVLSSVAHGMSMQDAGALKEALRTSPPQRTAEILADLNDTTLSPKTVLEKSMAKVKSEIQVGAKLSDINPGTLTEVTITPGTTVNVTPKTGQNLDVAHSVNLAVKSLISEGAPNQGPDLLRTGGRNYLLQDNLVTNPLNNSLAQDPLWQNADERAKNIDKVRGPLNKGEEYANVVSKAQLSAGLGTGKCAEHAATSFALLTDPESLEKMGVKLSEGSTVILALGDNIDHNYVLIAEPGSVTIGNDGRVTVHDAGKVVVVDPWVPIPTAHTLDRCNKEIQTDPLSKLAVTMKNGVPTVLDRNNRETPLPINKVPMIDQLNEIHQKYNPGVLKQAEKLKIVPKDRDTRLAVAVGKMEAENLQADNIHLVSGGKGSPLGRKPPPYKDSFMSTNTPQDKYQCVDKGVNVGKPTSYLVNNPQYVSSEHQHFSQAKTFKPDTFAFETGNMKLMPKDMSKNLRELKDFPEEFAKKPKKTVDDSTSKSTSESTSETTVTQSEQEKTTKQPKLEKTTSVKESLNSTTQGTDGLQEDRSKKVKQSSPKSDVTDTTAPKVKPKKLRDEHPELVHTETQKTAHKESNKVSTL